MRLIVAIDPGDVDSAWVVYDAETKGVRACAIEPNAEVLAHLYNPSWLPPAAKPEFAIEMVASYGMPVGKTIFDTVVWIGRYLEALKQFDRNCRLIVRNAVKQHICKRGNATDANISQAVIDRYGGTRPRAVGTAKAPGPLFGFKADIWAAMALAITAAETEAAYTLGPVGLTPEMPE